MLRQLWLPGQNAAFRRQFEQMGALLENIEHQEIGGWAYNRLVPLGGKDRPAPPRWLMPLLLQVVPEMRARIKQSRKAIQEDLHYRNIERWYREWHPDLAARIVTLRDLDPATLSDDALDEHLGRTVSLFEEGCTIHFMLIMTVIPILADLAFACRDLLGWDDGQAIELVSGLSAMSTEPSRRLADLARMARERPSVRDLLNGGDVAPDAVATRLTSVDGEFAAAFAEYQRHYGVRALRYEVADPTLAETPALVLALIRDQVARGYDPAADAAALAERRASAVAEARAALAGRSEADGARFERALRRAQEAYPVREDNEFYTVSAPHALVRYAALELGRRLAGRGLILERDDVFYLEMPEARAALRGGEARHALIVRRRAERAWVEAHPGPASYGRPPGPPPALDSLPAEARWLMAAILWGVEQVNAQAHPARSTAGGAALQGIGVSAGRYTGPARVIRDESEFHKIRAGDVLVCPITSPVWSVLFPSVGALVTDTGGLLSHPAIIAREYRVPAVVATGSATHALRDGQIVIVDGTAGLVEAVGR